MLVYNNTEGTSSCVYVATLVTRTRHNAALYVDCLCCLFKRYSGMHLEWKVGETVLQLCVEICHMVGTVYSSHS